jgi:hypothetical protein
MREVVGCLDEHGCHIQAKIRKVSSLAGHEIGHTPIPVFTRWCAFYDAVIRDARKSSGGLGYTIVDCVDVAIILVLFTTGSTRVDR